MDKVVERALEVCRVAEKAPVEPLLWNRDGRLSSFFLNMKMNSEADDRFAGFSIHLFSLKKIDEHGSEVGKSIAGFTIHLLFLKTKPDE